jgi:peroxiredoxin
MAHIPALHTVIPEVSLRDTHGRQVSIRAYRQKQPLVLVLGDAGDARLLDEFAERYNAYRGAGAEVLGLVANPPPNDFPFPVLIDREGTIRARLASRLPAVLLLDVYGELDLRWEGPWPGGLDHDDLLGEIGLLELQCPECGAPAWPRQ